MNLLESVLLVTLFLSNVDTGHSYLEWWQKANFYQVYPRSFYDSDEDGIGDLKGITLKADYIQELGIGGVWISPFFESPMKDFGYDIEDYRQVDPIFGTLEDFRELAQEYKKRGIYIIADFVPNHTSDKHEWFEKSRNRTAPYTDYYIWVDGRGPNGTDPPNNWISRFGDSAWEWCPIRQQFYLHQFLKEQPDLNYRNQDVRRDMKDVVRFWLEQGVGGFRVDALGFLFEDKQLRDEELSGLPVEPNDYFYLVHNLTTNLPEIYDVLGDWRQVCDEFKQKDGLHRVLMLELYDLTVKELWPYFGTDEHPLADMPFNFDLLSVRKGVTAQRVQEIIQDWLDNLPPGKWPNWVLGNHDQNRITNKTDVELLDGLNMITQLMKGTPVTYYGEEIAMVDGDISWNDTRDPAGLWAGPDGYKNLSRDPERTPMQWNEQKFAGFTNGSTTWLPVNPNYPQLNVEKQENETRSHLNTFKRLSNLRKEMVLIEGNVYFPLTTKSILSFVRATRGYSAYVVIVNFGNATEAINLVQDSCVQQFHFPHKAIVAVNSANIAEDSPLGSVGVTVDLDHIRLDPMQAVVLQFQPQWVDSEEEHDGKKNWWKKAIFYQVYPRSFFDTDGDGVGDLKGIISKADYFEYVGTGGVWLSPIYKSPMKDFGYDIANYTEIEPLFGSMQDFQALLKEMKSRNMKVIMDFVPNHTSNESIWFEKSRNSEEPYTDYYMWLDGKGPNKDQPPNNWMSMFGGSAWEWCPIRKQFYYHQFLVSQPDLNMNNAHVRQELEDVLKFWLNLGVDGFRIDAIKHLFEDPQFRDEPLSNIAGVQPDEYIYLNHIYTTSQPEVLDVLREWKDVFDDLEKQDGFHRILMVEINETIPNTVAYYGNATHPLADMPFNFELFKISNTSTAKDIHKLIKDWLDGVGSNWPNWVIGNHDQHRIANRTHAHLIDAFNMINLLLKGTAVVYYGEEIGMTDTKVTWEQTQDPQGLWYGPERYEKFSRDPERSPMQWSGAKKAGFTTGDTTWLPVNPNYKTVNVKTENGTELSHLAIFRKLVHLRKLSTFRKGEVLYPLVTDDILSFVRFLSGEPSYVVVINFGGSPQSINLMTQSTLQQFKFPKQGIVRVHSQNVDKSLKVDHNVQLDHLRLKPKEAVVIQFTPQMP